MYIVYEDFFDKKVLKIVKTRAEAAAIRKQFPKHSEVWYEKVDQNEKVDPVKNSK